MKRNNVKAMLKRGEFVGVPEINRVFSPKIVDVLGWLGYECIWIDMEHSDASYEHVYNLASAAGCAGMDVIVRIARGQYSSVIRPLEAGANGLVLPHCISADDARKFVRMAKFAPVGLRGMGCGRDSHFGTDSVPEYVEHANDETLLLVMIEDKEAVEDVDNIVAVEGIDGVFVGRGDLSHSYGMPGETEHRIIFEALEKISAACKKHNKAWGAVPLPGGKLDKLLALGAGFANIASDHTVLIEGFKAAREKMLHSTGKADQ